MEITVNKQIFEVSPNCTIAELVYSILKQSGNGTAVAIQEVIIPKTQWEKHILQPNDNIILIIATQGG